MPSFLSLLAALYVVAAAYLSKATSPHRRYGTPSSSRRCCLANVIGTQARACCSSGHSCGPTGPAPGRHVPVFFIFLVSNLGGLLTPLGDPPLFLGYLNGVDFSGRCASGRTG